MFVKAFCDVKLKFCPVVGRFVSGSVYFRQVLVHQTHEISRAPCTFAKVRYLHVNLLAFATGSLKLASVQFSHHDRHDVSRANARTSS